MRFLVPAICFTTLTALLPVAAQDSQGQVWPEVDLFLNLNQKFRLHTLYTGTRIENEQGKDQQQVTALLDISMLPIMRRNLANTSDTALGKYLTVSPGFSYMTPASSQPGSSSVYTPLVDVTPRYLLPWSIRVSTRSRGEFRFVGSDFSPRYRIRPQFERDFPVRKLILTPYANWEFYYYFSSHSWNQNVLQAGVSTQIVRWFALDLNCNRQLNHSSPPYVVTAFGVNAYFYLWAR